jgi:hypothetical protein
LPFSDVGEVKYFRSGKLDSAVREIYTITIRRADSIAETAREAEKEDA